jgi:hypothetical protein
MVPENRAARQRFLPSRTPRKAYEEFFGLWDGADPDLKPLKDARLEYARLDETRRDRGAPPVSTTR